MNKYILFGIVLVIVLAIVSFNFLDNTNTSQEIHQVNTFKNFISDVSPRKEVIVESQSYIDDYFHWYFSEINDTHWDAVFEINNVLWNDLHPCISKTNDDTCWIDIKNRYFPDEDFVRLKSDFLNMNNYPLKNFTPNMKFSNFMFDNNVGMGKFIINFPNGFKDGEKSVFGFGSTNVSSSSTGDGTLNPGGRAICRTTNRVHLIHITGGAGNQVFYLNFTDNSSSIGFSMRLDGSGSSDNANGAPPAIACNGNNVFAAWPASSSSVSIAYKNSTNEGASFDSTTNANNWTILPSSSVWGANHKLSVAYGAGNNIFLAYIQDDGTLEFVNITNSSSYGGEQPTLTHTRLTNDMNAASFISLFVNYTESPRTESIYMGLMGTVDDDLYFNFSNDGGSTWNGTEIVTGTYFEPNIVRFNSSLIFLTSYDSNSDIYIFNSTDNGTTWGAGVRIDGNGAGTSLAQFATLATDYNSIWVFWQNNDTTAGRLWDLYYRQWNQSSSWGNIIALDNISSFVDLQTSAAIDNRSNAIELIYMNRTESSSGATSHILYNFINLTLNPSTCTYSSGNWSVTCSDNCVISSNVDLANNSLIFTGSGQFTVNANITNIGQLQLSDSCTIAISNPNYISLRT